MKTRISALFHTAVPLLLAGVAFSATTSINTGSLGVAANGTNSDSVTLSNPGVLGGADQAAAYSGGARTTIPFQADLNPASGSPFTIEFWARPTASDNDDVAISNRYAPSGANRSGWVFYQRAAAVGWNFRMYNGNGSGVAWEVQGGTATLDAWSHVVATWSGSAATLYVNGALADDSNLAGTSGTYNTNSLSNNVMFSVGALFDGLSPSSGLLDEVAFYGSALTPAQIQNHFNLVSSNPGAYQATVLADGARLQLTNVPEPTAAWLLGLSGLALLRRRSRHLG